MVTAKDIQAAIDRRNAAIDTPEFQRRQDELIALVGRAKAEHWSERAAIREYDGGMTRADAERAAWDDVGGES
jgi:hypothetical protein